MSIRYTFRQLFYKRILRPRRLYQILVDFDKRISDLEDASEEEEKEPEVPVPPPADDESYTVSVSVDTTYEDIATNAYLVPEADLSSEQYENSVELVSGAGSFTDVESGTYYVFIESSNNEFIGVKQITVESSDVELSLELGIISYIIDSVSESTNTEVTVTDSDTSIELFTTPGSASTLVAGDYTFTVDGNVSYGTVVANTVSPVSITVSNDDNGEGKGDPQV